VLTDEAWLSQSATETGNKIDSKKMYQDFYSFCREYLLTNRKTALFMPYYRPNSVLSELLR
jgi:hypothetical protein